MNATIPQLESQDDKLPPRTLLMGAPGSGKTHSLRTYLEADLEVLVLVTEPMGLEVLADKAPMDQLHWVYLPVASPGWSSLIDSARKINTMSFEDLTNLKSGLSKHTYGQWISVLQALSNFTCQRCRKNFGAVELLDSHYALAIDSLSGLNMMSMDLVVGGKPTKHQGEWGVAMDNEERLINMLSGNLKCFFALTAHMSMEKDELTGGTSIMPDALGRKLAPRLPRFFSDIVKTQWGDGGYTWSTADSRIECLKARNLPRSNSIPPTFVPIVESWRRKQVALKESTASAA